MEFKERFLPIKGYEDYYEVSNTGIVRSLDRLVKCKNGMNMFVAGRPRLNPCLNHRNAQFVVLVDKSGHKQHHLVHRLVAEAFIPNPDNLPYVNHKDEDPTNNHVDNLEWCTAKYNTNYGTGIERSIAAKNREVAQYSKEGRLINVFDSCKIASESLGIGRGKISLCCNGKAKSAGGFVFVFTYGLTPPDVLDVPHVCKRVAMMNIKQEVLKVFESAAQANAETNAGEGHIREVCLGSRRSAGGYLWKYID